VWTFRFNIFTFHKRCANVFSYVFDNVVTTSPGVDKITFDARKLTTLSQRKPNIMTTLIGRSCASWESAAYILGVEINSTDQSTPSVCTCIGLYMAKHTRGASVRVKTRYFEKFKINIFTLCRIQTKLSTRKHLNTRSILLTWLWANSEEFWRYSNFFLDMK
jgi:hypothetical protein